MRAPPPSAAAAPGGRLGSTACARSRGRSRGTRLHRTACLCHGLHQLTAASTVASACAWQRRSSSSSGGLNVGRGQADYHQTPARADRETALAVSGPLGGVVAALTRRVRSLHHLAFQQAGTLAGLATGLLTVERQRHVADGVG